MRHSNKPLMRKQFHLLQQFYLLQLHVRKSAPAALHHRRYTGRETDGRRTDY
jgi:hypothetical protein